MKKLYATLIIATINLSFGIVNAQDIQPRGMDSTLEMFDPCADARAQIEAKEKLKKEKEDSCKNSSLDSTFVPRLNGYIRNGTVTRELGLSIDYDIQAQCSEDIQKEIKGLEQEINDIAMEYLACW